MSVCASLVLTGRWLLNQSLVISKSQQSDRMWSDEIQMTGCSWNITLLFLSLLDNKQKTSKLPWLLWRTCYDGPPSLKHGCQDSSPMRLSLSVVSALTPQFHGVTSSVVMVKAHRRMPPRVILEVTCKSFQPSTCQIQCCISKTPVNTVAGGTLVMPVLPLLSPLKLPWTLYFVSLGNSRGSWGKRKKKVFLPVLKKRCQFNPRVMLAKRGVSNINPGNRTCNMKSLHHPRMNRFYIK